MLPFYTRVLGLTSALTVKFAQDDLHVVNNLDIPSDEPGYLEDLVFERNWGPSVLFVDTHDIMPRNITLATDRLKHINLMPAYGENLGKLETRSLIIDWFPLCFRIERLQYAETRHSCSNRERR